ncbi:MCE family protein [Pseudomonas cavernae]|uniref:MCE family protein n=1 Tax=Pseudomonas cavernae TaxID=2320867 RepID=A0A385Z546_9PSED|nr:MlaD family protein [Pseudomonas cavernae]AYC32818.1 MCE family protein [Pseudomonas cavernae]
METRAHHILIGLFTVLAVGGALLFALWLGKSSVDKEFSLYDVVFNEAVTGLSIGSAVQYSGIKVGDVVQLKLDPKDPRKVLARIRVGGDTPIKENTRARLTLTGVTGSSIIQLHGGSPMSPPLATNNEQPAVIVATPSPLSRLLTNGEDLVSNISRLIANANLMFSGENIDRVSRTLEHLDQATGVLASQRGDIQETLKQLAEVSRQAGTMVQQTSELMHNTNALVDKQGRGILDNAAQTMAALERASGEIEQILSTNKDALNGGIQGIGELGPAVSELRSTLAALRQMSQRLSDNPSGLLLDRQQTQEFQP